MSQIQVDVNGNFEIEDVSVGPYAVRLLDLQSAFGTEATINVIAGQTTSGVQLTILPGGIITGRVTDALTSAGLANVQVLAYTPDGGATAPIPTRLATTASNTSASVCTGWRYS